MDIIDIARNLISIPSYLDESHNEFSIGEFIYDYLKSSGKFVVEKQLVEGNRFNIIAHDGKPAKLMFCCHMDTVPPSAGWQRNPLEGQVEENRIYGLGACDMKGGTAALLSALNSIQDTSGLFLLFDVDEEYYFKGMLKFLQDYQHIRPELAVFPEPGLEIRNGHRGLIEVNLKVRGKSAHAARPELGRNAILGASRAVEHLLIELENYQHPSLGTTSCNLAWLKGGIDQGNSEIRCRANKIPDLAEIVLDIRPAHPDLDAYTILEILKKHLDANGYQIEAEQSVLDFGSLFVPTENLERFIKMVNLVSGEVKYSNIKEGGYGEGQLLNKHSGVACVYYGPGSIEMAHQANEYVAVDQLETARSIYSKLIQEYCAS